MICWASVRGVAAATGVAGTRERRAAPARATGMNARAPMERERNRCSFLPAGALGRDGESIEPRAHEHDEGASETREAGRRPPIDGTGRSTTDMQQPIRGSGAMPCGRRVLLVPRAELESSAGRTLSDND